MSKRWSKLQREIYTLIDESINMQIHCSIYRMDSQYGSTDLPRYWITLGKEIIFDYPKQFNHELYPYITEVSCISNIIREYIDTPLERLLDYQFENDKWGLTDILKAADRRIGKKRLKDYFENSDSNAVKSVLLARFTSAE